jgi:adenine-specific DNA-methyltransferase
MRGFVPTPVATVDQMVAMLFRDRPPLATDHVLDPGCGLGAFIEGILRWCRLQGTSIPSITGIELDPERFRHATDKFADIPQIRILQADFLSEAVKETYDFVIANPPYISILGIDDVEREDFRRRYRSAVGRFDLYMLFIEQALAVAKPNATLVFITPEKYTYVQSGTGLRQLLASRCVTDLALVDEAAFPGRITYPAITRVEHRQQAGQTRITWRDQHSFNVSLPTHGETWRHLLSSDSSTEISGSQTLAAFCTRISCGIATGADAVFVKELDELPSALIRHAWPTISGRQLQPLGSNLRTSSVMLIPYSTESRLKPLGEIDALADYLKRSDNQEMLRKRSCSQRKPWYAFHDAPQMADLLRPKILCKDICDDPVFWIDADGAVIPRHSVYYLVPSSAAHIYEIADYLNSSPVKAWLQANAQRAANGFLRMQSSVLKHLPVPDDLAARWTGLHDPVVLHPTLTRTISAEVRKAA